MAHASARGGAAAGLGGCASLPNGAKPDPRDRFERINRAIYTFNVACRSCGAAARRPRLRQDHAAPGARTAYRNFMTNLTLHRPPSSTTSCRASGAHGAQRHARGWWSTHCSAWADCSIGHALGLDRHDADFGQTLGRWGVHSGPYVMLPFLGPSTVRDAFGLLPTNTPRRAPTSAIPRCAGRSSRSIMVDQRAHCSIRTRYIDQSFDPYAFVRNA